MLIKNRILNKKGQSLVEYLVLLAVVVLGVIVGMTFFKNTVANAFNSTGNTLSTRTACEINKIATTSPETE